MSVSHSRAPGKKEKEINRELNLENSQRGVWLVKVPKYIR